jgi:L-ornithine Nalpha-acyltransferase
MTGLATQVWNKVTPEAIARNLVMDTVLVPATEPVAPKYTVRLARSDDLPGLFRLRHDVFVKEMAGQSESDLVHPMSWEVDEYDTVCDHLVALQKEEVVGTYRMLRAAKAAEYQMDLYSSSEFDLSPLKTSLGDTFEESLMELGRSCVAAEHRNSVVPKLMWGALSQYMMFNRCMHFIGCVSVQVPSEKELFELCGNLKALGVMAKEELMCEVVASDNISKPSFSIQQVPVNLATVSNWIPPLMKSYISMGAKVLSGPAFDKAFQCYDFLMYLNLAEMDAKYLRSFFRR